MPRLVKGVPVHKATKNKRTDSLLQTQKSPAIRYTSQQKSPYDIVANMKHIQASIDMEKECAYLFQNICLAINRLPQDIN